LLVTTEWQDKVAGAVAAGRSTLTPPPWRLTTWLHEMDGAEPKSDSLRDWTVRFSREAGGLDAGDEETKRIAVEMMTFNYYAATLLEFFSSTGVASELRDLTDPDGKTMDGVEVAKLETLAKARQQFATDPRLAWQLVGQARQSAGLATW
jgi:hypothetical protein